MGNRGNYDSTLASAPERHHVAGQDADAELSSSVWGNVSFVLVVCMGPGAVAVGCLLNPETEREEFRSVKTSVLTLSKGSNFPSCTSVAQW